MTTKLFLKRKQPLALTLQAIKEAARLVGTRRGKIIDSIKWFSKK